MSKQWGHGYYQGLSAAVDILNAALATGGITMLGDNSITQNKKSKQQEDYPINPSVDLSLLIAIAINRSNFPRVRLMIDVQDIESVEARKIFIALEECYRSDEDDMERFLLRLGDDRLGRLVMEKAARGEFSIQPERFIDDSVRAVRIRSLGRKRDEITGRIIHMSNTPTNKQMINDLIFEKKYIDDLIYRTRAS